MFSYESQDRVGSGICFLKKMEACHLNEAVFNGYSARSLYSRLRTNKDSFFYSCPDYFKDKNEKWRAKR